MAYSVKYDLEIILLFITKPTHEQNQQAMPNQPYLVVSLPLILQAFLDFHNLISAIFILPCKNYRLVSNTAGPQDMQPLDGKTSHMWVQKKFKTHIF